MITDISDMQRLGQQNMEAATRFLGEWTRGWQAIAAEMSDYTKRSFEDGTSTLQKLMDARTPDQAMAIQASYVKRSYDGYFQQMSKISGMYMNLAKDTMKPLEKPFGSR